MIDPFAPAWCEMVPQNLAQKRLIRVYFDLKCVKSRFERNFPEPISILFFTANALDKRKSKKQIFIPSDKESLKLRSLFIIRFIILFICQRLLFLFSCNASLYIPIKI